MKLKTKNREWLEDWYADYICDCLETEEDYRYQVALDGLVGAHQLNDEDLLSEYKEYIGGKRA